MSGVAPSGVYLEFCKPETKDMKYKFLATAAALAVGLFASATAANADWYHRTGWVTHVEGVHTVCAWSWCLQRRPRAGVVCLRSCDAGAMQQLALQCDTGYHWHSYCH
jgi:hypothetical protein